MQTSQGTVDQCTQTLSDSDDSGVMFVSRFQLHDWPMEFETVGRFGLSNGDEVIVAGVPGRGGKLVVLACRNLTTDESWHFKITNLLFGAVVFLGAGGWMGGLAFDASPAWWVLLLAAFHLGMGAYFVRQARLTAEAADIVRRGMAADESLKSPGSETGMTC